MTREPIRKGFDGFDAAQYADEAQQRWGETAAYQQSAERTKRYTKADWEQIKAEGEALTRRYINLMERGTLPTDPVALATVADHQAYFQRWFYDASPEMMRGVAQLWISDPRFTKNIDSAKPGLAAYQAAAVNGWADAQARQ